MNNNEPEIPRVKNLAIKKRKEKENGGRKDELREGLLMFWASLVAQRIKNLPAVQETQVQSTCSTGDPGSILGSGRSPGEGTGHPLSYSCLKNPMDIGVWRDTVHEIATNQT